jgi:hypothetical protein
VVFVTINLKIIWIQLFVNIVKTKNLLKREKLGKQIAGIVIKN